ncbi:putative GTPase activating protein for Arf-domain-containing protein [Fomitopsis serialis]|uniref:putative GTPase activating protein for Arf-domain-containing protein n=1 Tax=Fomitopsis serialis TaxID=139415 RepID=UPI002007F39C|nr:putative GTPase activating protein for Arf-domain-containing protein [Neoantrodia serialis]KAH9915756.1 putative GTPase activating protein for Arf-domain-containing protein [Neoantrodia serialis]
MNKISAERNQRTLLELASVPGNDACADCRTRNPRWASHSLGISYGAMNCASIHRKMGTHISKVKSLTMDTWTKEQVEFMKSNGNVKSNAYYNPDETRHPPPTNMVDSERDSDLEKFIRSKYEFKSYINRGAAAAALLGPSKSHNRVSPGPPARSQTVPAPAPPAASSAPPVPPKTPLINTAPAPSTATTTSPMAQPSTTAPSAFSSPQFRSVSQPVSSSPTSFTPHTALPSGMQAQQPPVQQSSTWTALASLQTPSSSAQSTFTPSRPLQMSQGQQANSSQFSASPQPNIYSGLSASPSSPFPSSVSSFATGAGQGGVPRSMSLGTGLALNVNVGSPMISSLTPGGASPYQTTSPYQTSTALGASAPFQPSPSPFQPSSSPYQPSSAPYQPSPSPYQPSPSPFQQQPTSASPFQPQGNHGLGLSAPSANPYAGLSASPMGGGAFPVQQTGSFQPQSSPYMQASSQQAQPTSQQQFFQQQSLGQMPMQPAFGSGANPFFQNQSPAQPQLSRSRRPGVQCGNPYNGWQGQQQYAGQQWTGM